MTEHRRLYDAIEVELARIGVRDEDAFNIGSDGPPDAAWLEAVLAWLRSVGTGVGTAGLLRDARRSRRGVGDHDGGIGDR